MTTPFPEFTQYISPYGDVFNFDGYYKFIMSEEGFGMPPIEYTSQVGPFQHGETIISYRLKPRVIQIGINQKTMSRWDYWEARASLMDIFRPNNHLENMFGPGILRKNLPDGTARDIQVFFDAGLSFDSIGDRNMFSVSEIIRLRAPDPTFFNPDPVTFNFSFALSDELTFPFTIDNSHLTFGDYSLQSSLNVSYVGTWHSCPTIVLTGPLDGVILSNITMNQRIQLNYALADAEVVTISLAEGNKSVQNNFGVNLIGLVDSLSDFATFRLSPGPNVNNGLNVINVFSPYGIVGSSAASISYYSRYIGI